MFLNETSNRLKPNEMEFGAGAALEHAQTAAGSKWRG